MTRPPTARGRSTARRPLFVRSGRRNEFLGDSWDTGNWTAISGGAILSVVARGRSVPTANISLPFSVQVEL
jgi:hypothetical protein